jgi:membrane protease YdiL (CAAX protease family)
MTATEVANDPYLFAVIQVVSMYVIAFPYFCLTVRKIPKATRLKSSIGLGEFIALFAMALASMQIGSVISQIASNYLTSALSFNLNYSITYSLLQSGKYLPTLIWAVILAPIVEEIMFRKILIDRLSVYGDRLAIYVSAVAFGLFHGNILQVFYATLAGIILGHVYTKTRRLIYSVIIHMLVNLLGTLPSILYEMEFNVAPEGFIDTELIISSGMSPLAVLLVIESVLILFGFVMFVVAIFNKKYRFSRECDIEIPKFKLLRVVVLNKGTLLFAAYSVLSILALIIFELSGFNL